MSPDLAPLLTLVPFLIVIGAFAGIVAGLLGVGGGIILVPAFLYCFTALGYNGPMIMQVCLATSLATIIFTSARSVLSHHRKGAVDWAILRGWAPGIALGALLGVLVASGVRSQTLVLLFGILGTLIGLHIAFGRQTWRFGDTLPAGWPRRIAAPLIGFLSVLMGIGGGSFGVPLMRLYGTPMHRAVATAAGFGITIAVPSVAAFLLTGRDVPGKPPLTLGLVNLPAFALIIATTLLTAPLGVRLAHSLDETRLRRIFGIFIIVMALNMLRKGL